MEDVDVGEARAGDVMVCCFESAADEEGGCGCEVVCAVCGMSVWFTPKGMGVRTWHPEFLEVGFAEGSHELDNFLCCFSAFCLEVLAGFQVIMVRRVCVVNLLVDS